MAPLLVANQIVKEVTDQTCGKDKKEIPVVAREAFIGLGYGPMLYRMQVDFMLSTLMQAAEKLAAKAKKEAKKEAAKAKKEAAQLKNSANAKVSELRAAGAGAFDSD